MSIFLLRLPRYLAQRADTVCALVLTQAPHHDPARVLALAASRVLRRDQLATLLGDTRAPIACQSARNRLRRTVQGAA